MKPENLYQGKLTQVTTASYLELWCWRRLPRTSCSASASNPPSAPATFCPAARRYPRRSAVPAIPSYVQLLSLRGLYSRNIDSVFIFLGVSAYKRIFETQTSVPRKISVKKLQLRVRKRLHWSIRMLTSGNEWNEWLKERAVNYSTTTEGLFASTFFRKQLQNRMSTFSFYYCALFFAHLSLVYFIKYDLRSSQHWLWRVPSSGIQCCVDRWKIADVSEKHFASIFRVKE